MLHRLSPPLLVPGLIASPVFAQEASSGVRREGVVREEQGNRVSENIPPIPAELLGQLNR